MTKQDDDIIYGLSATVMGEITFENGQVEQKNFDSYDTLRMANAPEIDIKIVQHKSHISGIGEPGIPRLCQLWPMRYLI